MQEMWSSVFPECGRKVAAFLAAREVVALGGACRRWQSASRAIMEGRHLAMPAEGRAVALLVRRGDVRETIDSLLQQLEWVPQACVAFGTKTSGVFTTKFDEILPGECVVVAASTFGVSGPDETGTLVEIEGDAGDEFVIMLCRSRRPPALLAIGKKRSCLCLGCEAATAESISTESKQRQRKLVSVVGPWLESIRGGPVVVVVRQTSAIGDLDRYQLGPVVGGIVGRSANVLAGTASHLGAPTWNMVLLSFGPLESRAATLKYVGGAHYSVDYLQSHVNPVKHRIQPAWGFNFTCIDRGEAWHEAESVEASAHQRFLGPNFPIIGFFAMGEIGPPCFEDIPTGLARGHQYDVCFQDTSTVMCLIGASS